MSEKRKFRLSILSLWIGIFIPIFAASIPYFYKHLWPEHDLVFEVIGPISVKEVQAFTIKIKNQGSRSERNIRVWIKANPYFRVQLQPNRQTTKAEKSPTEFLVIETTAPNSVSFEKDSYVVSLGDLRPGEIIEASFLSEAIQLSHFRFSSEVHGLSVKSDEHVAKLSGVSDLEMIVYRIGFWLLVLLMIVFLTLWVYQQYFMDPKKKEELILKEIDKLGKS